MLSKKNSKLTMSLGKQPEPSPEAQKPISYTRKTENKEQSSHSSFVCFPSNTDIMSFLKLLNFSIFKHSAINEERYVQDNIEYDCWEMIFKLIQEDDPHDFVSLSLVCKRFLSITNQMKTSLIVSEWSARHLPRVLRRFQHIKSICINTSLRYYIESLVCQISQSRLQHLEALEFLDMKSFPREGLRKLGTSTSGLRKLKCVGGSLYNEDLILLTDLFPCLEELNLNCFKIVELVTARWVEDLASKLKKLKNVTFFNCSALTDEAIMCLSSNCKDLTGIEIQYCKHVTENSIGFLMRHSSKLTSLILTLCCEQSSLSNEHQFTIENSIPYARNLEEIQLWEMDISDDFLCSIAKSCVSLKRIDVDTRWRKNFTMRGLTIFLKVCSSLISFTPGALWLTDEHMLEICEHLRGLTYINFRTGLSTCSSLTCVTFFMLTQNCPLLESIVMDNTKVGIMEDVDLVLHQNNRVKYLSMNHCELLNDKALLRFVRVCPYIESLDISCCQGNFTDEGMAEILRICPRIRHLNISYVKVSHFLGSDNSKLKLNTIQAEGTWIDDKALGTIGERCPDLEELYMGWCDRVTGYGLIPLVSKCKKLKKINMQRCKFLSLELLDWMVAKRPSLKEIVPPLGFVPSEERRDLFLANGCLLLNGCFFWEEGI